MRSFEEKVSSALKFALGRNVKIEGNCGENAICCTDNKIRVRFAGAPLLPDGLTVGGWLVLSGCTGAVKAQRTKCAELQDGDYIPGRYLYADGILTHVAREKKIGEYTYYIGKIKGKNVVFDGNNYAHCKTFSEGVLDLSFKAAQDRGADQYSALTVDSVVAKDDAVTMYRVITGACKAGTEQFIGNLPEVKPEYKIAEIIDMTRNAYGGEKFRNFFDLKGINKNGKHEHLPEIAEMPR